MLGTIEELEKEIEQFQTNVAASNHMYELLSKTINQVKQMNKDFDSHSTALLSKLDEIPGNIKDINLSNNKIIREDISKELDQVYTNFSKEQQNYIKTLEQLISTLHDYIEQSKKKEESFNEKSTELIEKVAAVPGQIKNDNNNLKIDVKNDIDQILQNRNAQFVTEQNKYIAELQQTQQKMKLYQDQLELKYNEFVETLNKTNISSIYDQNIKLKETLDKRTTLLITISVISIIVGIIGIII